MTDQAAAATTAPEAPAALAATQSAAELSMQKIRAIRGNDNADDGAELTGNDNAGEQTEPPAQPKPKRKEVDPKGDEHAAFREMAKKLGYEMEDGRVLPSERHAFREHKRKQQAAIDAEFQKRMAEVTEREKTASARAEKADQLERAMEAGDHDGIAKLLGHDDWNKLQESIIARVSDPNYKRLRELEREAEERKKQETETKKQAEQREQQEKQQAARRQYFQGLQKTMGESKDPLLAALHDEPFVVSAIMNIQGQHYDRESNKVPPPEKALRMSANGAAKTLHDELHGMYLKLHRVFGSAQQPAANGNAKPQVAQKKPAPKSAPVPPSATVEASAPGRWGDRPKKDWFAYQSAKIQEALEQDEAERASRRR